MGSPSIYKIGRRGTKIWSILLWYGEGNCLHATLPCFSYQTGDGISAQANGFQRNLGVKDAESQVVQGSYSYTGPDGVVYTVNYIADENGYRAEGAHLPTPPPATATALAAAKNINYYQQQAYRQPFQSRPFQRRY